MCCIKDVCSMIAVIIDVVIFTVGVYLCLSMSAATEDLACTLFGFCVAIQIILLIIRCQRCECVSERFIFQLDLVGFPAIYMPQFIIVIYIMYTREISDIFFHVEAFAVLAGIFWRITMSVLSWQDTTPKWLTGFLIILIITPVFTVLVLIFGSQDYFKNVGVFLHHPDYNIFGGQDYWTHIIDLYDIPSQPHVSKSFIYRYEKTATHLNFAFHREMAGEGSSECYQVSLMTRNITAVYSTDCWTSMFTEPTSAYMTFTYLKLRHSLETIYYNIKMWNGSSCTSYKDVTNGVQPVLRIYVMNDSLRTLTGSHFLVDEGQPRFYGSQRGDLQDIAYVWDTWPTKLLLDLHSYQHVVCDD